MQRWKGKNVVVTGASAGIGAAVCLALADAGLHVIGLARRPQLVEKLLPQVTGPGSIHARQCDVSQSEDVANTFKWVAEQFGTVHVLVNNAGVFPQGHITDVGKRPLSEAVLMSTIDINLKGSVMCAKHAIASMKAANFDGHVINVNSLAGHYVPFASSFNVYSSTKYGMTAFTAALNNELGHFKSKIKATSLSPGLVETDLVPSKNDTLPALQPVDIAEAVLYVLSTPPHVNISELTITPVSELRL